MITKSLLSTRHYTSRSRMAKEESERKTNLADFWQRSPGIMITIGVSITMTGMIGYLWYRSMKIKLNYIHELKQQILTLEQSERHWKSTSENLSKNLITTTQQYNETILQLKDLTKQSVQIVNSLQSPNIRGKWGEKSLKRAIEQMGLSSYCDYSTQVSFIDPCDETIKRPDVIIKLTENHRIVVDSKVPFTSYEAAIQSNDPIQREKYFKDHAKSVVHHMKLLSQTKYHQLPECSTVPFIVMYLPYESLFSSALEYDPELLDKSMQYNVILTSPATLIALLHLINVMITSNQFTLTSQQLLQYTQHLQQNTNDFITNITKIGTSLERSVKVYNTTVNSFQSKLLPSMKFPFASAVMPTTDFKEIKVKKKEFNKKIMKQYKDDMANEGEEHVQEQEEEEDIDENRDERGE